MTKLKLLKFQPKKPKTIDPALMALIKGLLTPEEMEAIEKEAIADGDI